MKHYLRALALTATLAAPLAVADYEDGVTAAQNGDYATALREFTTAAEAGLDLAQYNLGILYYLGQGVEHNYAEALRWTLAAAEQGHVNAQFNLASLYYYGTGTAVDYAQALRWNLAAAEAQHAGAQHSLAKMYELGEGTEVDLVRAHFWASASQYDENAEGNVEENADATALLDELAAKMSAAQLSEARKAFAEWTISR
ncbi:MAG: tetratricopeptide repeat protein [Pseudomonadota bacterium]